MGTDEAAINKEKFEALNKLLDGEYALVHVDSAIEDLSIPQYLLKDRAVTLKLSRWFRGAMEITNELITADLLFNGNYFTCRVPYHAIWGMTGSKGESLIWPDSGPPGIIRTLKVLSTRNPVPKKDHQGPTLVPVDAKKDEEQKETEPSSEAAQELPPTPPSPKKRPQLKRVK